MTSGFWIQLATCFGIGRTRIAPGTAASFAALLFLFDRSTPQLQAVLIFLFFFIGVKAASAVIEQTGRNDPSEVVIDEVCGILVTFFLVSPSWITAVIGFFLFRFFDIVKPFPIRQLERLPKGWGVMSDDVVAGLCANAILHNINFFLLK